MSEETKPGPDVPPDHLAISPRSPFFNEEVLMRGIGIRFKDVIRTNIEEYSISEGWVRVQAGKSMDRKGQPLTLKLNGPVEAWFEDLGENPPVAKL
jgi:site-specific recombinase XerC